MAKRAGFYLSLLNFIFFVAGAAAAAVAGLLMDGNREYGALLGGGMFTLPLIVLFVGMGLLLLALLAWIGVLHASTCLLYTYAGLQLAAVATEIVVVTLVLVYKERTEKAVQRAMTGVFRSYGHEDNVAVTFSLDRAQHKLQCCGVLSFVEWGNTTFGAEYGVPDGCCRTLTEGCGQGILLRPEFSAKQAVHSRGCYTTVRGQVERGVSAIIAMVVIFVFAQVQHFGSCLV
ncbi:tetraspanin-3-like isoform X2 [Portunus trituberculatus]|uniref:tetraspanin-3-like isoform X2 n=1 Tax=Portunus trituberculatus TaxID=210409 RepID=UPI001E1CD55C|nr:tetraspanin-3-like isoform X2 [Portunus trituberculatus]